MDLSSPFVFPITSKETTEMWSRDLHCLHSQRTRRMIYETPLPFEEFHRGPAPVCPDQPHHQPPCPSHLISIHPLSLDGTIVLGWACFPPALGRWKQVPQTGTWLSAPAFGGASWTTNTRCPQPAPLAAQPDVTEASRSHLLSRLEQHWPGSRCTPHLGVPAVHRRAAPSTPKLKRHSWGPPEREETEDHSSAVF